jgi:hypothetical protein
VESTPLEFLDKDSFPLLIRDNAMKGRINPEVRAVHGGVTPKPAR